MSYSQGSRPEFPELNIPQSEQSSRRSPLRVIEPYVDFAADIEANVAKIEIGSEERLRTAGGKGNRDRVSSMGNGSRSANAQVHGGQRVMCSSTPSGSSRRQLTKGPESSRLASARSPRAVKTAPAQPSVSTTSNSNLSEDTSCGVRESLQSIKRGNAKPAEYVAPSSLYENTVVPKSSFAKAVDSIAAMKLHDYALKRKERMKNRFKLWDEIKGTTRELEISSAELAFMEFQEIIAAWKIKYYVSKSRDAHRIGSLDNDKKSLIRQCRGLKKKVGQLQKSIDEHLALNLADKAKSLLLEKADLEDELEKSHSTNADLLKEIQSHKDSYAQLENVLTEERNSFADEKKEYAQKVEDAKSDTAMVREDLEVSRRTAQEYLRSVMELEVTLQDKVDEITGLREGDLQESAQKSIRIESMQREIEELQSTVQGDSEQIQALEISVENLQKDCSAIHQSRDETEKENNRLFEENKSLKKEVDEKQIKINSLEKLVTEVTYQKEQFAKQLSDKGVVAGNYLVETVQLKEVIAQKENELEEHQFALSQMEEYTKYAQSVNEIANIERESALMHGEDLLGEIQALKDSLDQNVSYCRMLEAQLVSARRKEHYSQSKQRSAVLSRGLTTSRPSTQGGDNEERPPSVMSTNIFTDKLDFSEDAAADFSHPVEERLVSLLTMLEEKLKQLEGQKMTGTEEKPLRRKSIRRPSVPSKDAKAKDETPDPQPQPQPSDQEGGENDNNESDNIDDEKEKKASEENDAGEGSGENTSKSDPPEEQQGEEQDEEVDWEEVCTVLEGQLAEEKNKLEGLKNRLAEARENIQQKQREKEKLKVEIKKWQKAEQKRTGKLPTVKGNSIESRSLFTRSEEVEREMQQFLVQAQELATTALNCKMECDRLQDELYEADAEAYEVRLAAQQEEGEREGEGEGEERDSAPLSSSGRRNEARATISMLNQDHFASNNPHLNNNDNLGAVREEDEFEEESSGSASRHPHPTNLLKTSSVEFDGQSASSATVQNSRSHQERSVGFGFEPSTALSLDSTDLTRVQAEYREQMSKQELDRSSCEKLFRLLHTRLYHHHQVLAELEEEKSIVRQHIEKWTLYFLRDQGRVPGLSDSKYGANNLIFHNFNAIEADIFAQHQAIQDIFKDFDSKRDRLLNMNDQVVTEQLMQVEEHFRDPLFSLPEGEEYEDAFKLHFESVETSLLNGIVESEVVNDDDYLPNNTLVFDEIEDAGKLEILESLAMDIKSFQDDVAELHVSLQDSRESAERLHDSLKFHKGKIRQWHERFEQKFGRSPSEEDKEKEASHLYLKAHEVHSELEAELEKMRVFALIATAKNTEIDRLKILKRKFGRQAPPDYLPSEESSVASSHVHGASLSRMHAASQELREHSKNTFESKHPSIRSDANESEFRQAREALEAEIAKMSEELDMLKSFIRTADADIDKFRGKKAKLKSDAKKWEQSYQEKFGRKPTVEERKSQAEDLYEAYAEVQESLSQTLESRERAIKMITKIQQNCDRKNRKLAKVVEKEEAMYPRRYEYY